MTGQLFDAGGPVRTGGGKRVIQRGLCAFAGCDHRRSTDPRRNYCDTHECDVDSCVRMARDRGRCNLHAYCPVPGCSNTRRIGMQAAKYCDEHATSRSYELTGLQGAECYVCGASITARSGSATPMCRDHQHLREMLVRWRRVYRIDQAHARKLLDEPTCWICGGSLAWRFTGRAYRGGKIEAVHVDHDHGCRNGCTGQSSCGECVRGLAHGHCNVNLGHLETLINTVGVARARELVAVLFRDGGDP